MVKILGATFAAMLVCAHFADVQGDAYHRPLSMFRDYEPAWIGYALFALLIAIGFETIRTACRLRADVHVVMYLVFTGLLIAVAATPSTDSLHTTCALVAMAIMFVYYAVLLYLADELFWLVMHLLMPSFLMMGSQLESYGIWQKGMILYFLIAVVVHQGALAQWLPKPARFKSTRYKIAIGRSRAV
jgi:hypothetical protein